jgi:hypothetical protein
MKKQKLLLGEYEVLVVLLTAPYKLNYSILNPELRIKFRHR